MFDIQWYHKIKWAVTCDFQQCGILRSVDSDEHVQPLFKLRSYKWCSVNSLTLIDNSSDKQRLWSDCAYAQADLRLCWSHIPHCWQSHAAAQMIYGYCSLSVLEISDIIPNLWHLWYFGWLFSALPFSRMSTMFMLDKYKSLESFLTNSERSWSPRSLHGNGRLWYTPHLAPRAPKKSMGCWFLQTIVFVAKYLIKNPVVYFFPCMSIDSLVLAFAHQLIATNCIL